MPVYEFGEWRVDSTEHLLLRHGKPVPLTPKVFETLLLLVENAGHLVSKERFISRIWPSTFVEDVALAQNVSHLRRALQLSEADGFKIETVPKRGYRLLGQVRQVPDSNQLAPSALRPPESPGEQPALSEKQTAQTKAFPQPSPPRTSSRRSASGLVSFYVSVVVIAIVGFTLLRHHHAVRAASMPPSSRRVSHLPASAIIPLISLPGEERMPVFSPDGSRIAFHWASPQPKQSGIYAVVVGSQSLLRLTGEASDISPAWSPDGRFVAFVRTSGDAFAIYLVPALGGAARKLYTGRRIPWVGPDGISFSPDGNSIAFAEWSPESVTSSIKVLSVANSAVHTLTTPPSGYHDSAPAFSPDGQHLAFVRTTGPIFLDELYVMPLSGGEPKPLTFDHHRLFGSLLWTQDGKEIFFASNRAGLKSLWRIPASGGSPEPVLGPGPVADHPSISSATGDLAYEYSVEDENLWRVDLSARGTQATPSALFSAKSSNLMPQFSPDGRKIAFEGDRSGYEEIWISDPDGSNPFQVTHLERFSGSPRWSPDGQRIVFDSRLEEHSGIFVVDLASGLVRSIATFSDADNVVPSWSRDGQWIYFTSDHGSKTFHIWKAPINGGVSVPVTKDAGFAAFESDDQKFIYYTRLLESGIWRAEKNGKAETKIWNGPGPDNWGNWALLKDAIYFTVSERGKRSVIKRLDLRTRRIVPITTLERPAFYGLTVSAGSIIYSQRDRDEHDVVVTKLFQ